MLKPESKIRSAQYENKLTLSVSNSAESINLVSKLLTQAGYRPFNPQNGNLCLVSDRVSYPFGIELLPPDQIIRATLNNQTDLGIILSDELISLPTSLNISQLDSRDDRLSLLCNSGDYPEEIWRKWIELAEPFKKPIKKLQSTGVFYF